MRKPGRFARFAGLLIVLLGSCSEHKPFAGTTLRVGFDNAPPYTVVFPDGSRGGLAVELLEEAARRQQIHLQWIRVEKPGLTGFDIDSMLQRGDFDLWPVVGITAQRLTRIHVARPWLENSFFLVSRKVAPVQSIRNLQGRRILYIEGPLGNEMARKFLAAASPVPVRGFANILGPVCRGQEDVAFVEARTLETLLLDRPQTCAGVPLGVSSVHDAVSHAGIGARKQVAAQAEALTNEIVLMAADGTFARSVDRWSSFSASEMRSLVALEQAHEHEVIVRRGLWALLGTSIFLGGVSWFAFRASRNAERARAIEASRAEVLRKLAGGASLGEMLAQLNRSLQTCCPRPRCSIILTAHEDSMAVRTPFLRSLPIEDSRGSAIGEIRFRIPEGRLSRAERTVIDGFRQLTAVVAEHRMLHTALRKEARQDRLTGLANRAVFAEAISQLTETETEAALFYFDLDRFKQVNDRFGHATGDAYLRQAAERITRCFDPEDLVARMGGDEFAVLSPSLKTGDFERVCEAVLNAFRVPFTIDDLRIPGGVSIGASAFPRDGRSPAELQSSADAALYEAKRSGGNRFRVCCPEIRECAAAVVRAERLIRHALDHNLLELFFQPQMTVRGELAGMEALVRIRHPEQGLIAASEFIEIAEHAGLVTEIDSWVLPEAMRHYAGWRDRGLDPVRIAVNISRLDLSHAKICDVVLSSLNRFDLNLDALQLELTESAAVLGGNALFEVMEKLSKLGVSLALDDFGRGYSSLSCLHGLPVDTVKIDKSFVHRLTNDVSSKSLIAAVIAAAKTLQMVVVAEGVESRPQERLLRDLGCDVLQGHHIMNPLSATDAGRFLAHRHRKGSRIEAEWIPV